MSTVNIQFNYLIGNYNLGNIPLCIANNRITLTVYLLLIIAVLFVILIKKKHSYWKDLGVPYTKPQFLIGNTLQRLGIWVPFYEVGKGF